jgi:hypothetical protein|tara:strand:- start:330 stop:482 length:153 start_codon:yes stop_codon:yes gene_type:complete
MLRDSIKCSQCDETFPSGYDYRMHWEKHLDEFLKEKKENDKQWERMGLDG